MRPRKREARLSHVVAAATFAAAKTTGETKVEFLRARDSAMKCNSGSSSAETTTVTHARATDLWWAGSPNGGMMMSDVAYSFAAASYSQRQWQRPYALGLLRVLFRPSLIWGCRAAKPSGGLRCVAPYHTGQSPGRTN